MSLLLTTFLYYVPGGLIFLFFYLVCTCRHQIFEVSSCCYNIKSTTTDLAARGIHKLSRPSVRPPLACLYFGPIHDTHSQGDNLSLFQ